MFGNVQHKFQKTVDIIEEKEWDGREKASIQYLADYYRHLIDNSKEMFASELPEYTGNYITVQEHIEIMDLVDEYNTKNYIVRDIIYYYREFAYLNGFRYNDEGKYQTIDLSEYKLDHTRELLEEYNDWIKNCEIMTQQAYLTLKLVSEYYNRTTGEHKPIPEGNGLGLFESVNEVVSKMYEANQPSEPIEWSKLGGSLDYSYNELHHKGLEESAKNKLKRQLKNGEIKIEDL